MTACGQLLETQQCVALQMQNETFIGARDSIPDLPSLLFAVEAMAGSRR